VQLVAAGLVGAVLGGGVVGGLAALAAFDGHGPGYRHGGPVAERGDGGFDRDWPGDRPQR
jgi:hypothetical protein